MAISSIFVATMADAKSRPGKKSYSSGKSYSSSYKSKSYSSPKKSKSYSTSSSYKPAKKTSGLGSAAAMAAIGAGLFLMNDDGNIEYNGVEFGDLDDLCAAVSNDQALIELCDMVD